MTDPARDLTANNNAPHDPARDDLDLILSEARAALRPRTDKTLTVLPRDNAPGAPGTSSKVLRDSALGSSAGSSLPQDLESADTVKFHNLRAEIADPTLGRAREQKSPLGLIVAVGLGLFAVLLWNAMPSGMDSLQPKTLAPAYADASARWALAMTAERIDRYYAEHAELPASLDAVGGNPIDLLTYEPLGDHGYRLTAPGKSSVIVLDPTTSISDVLGSSSDALRAGTGDGR